MKCFLLSNDLMFGSQVSGAGKMANVEVQTIGNVDAIIDRASGPEGAIVVVDLTMPNVDLATLTDSLRALTPAPKLIAIGPHVHAERLAAAQSAGFDHVLSKGQAMRELPALLAQLVA